MPVDTRPRECEVLRSLISSLPNEVVIGAARFSARNISYVPHGEKDDIKMQTPGPVVDGDRRAGGRCGGLVCGRGDGGE